ncbi:hypothetical protein MATL_G00259290 [Megalops atlanticus]|uniref:KxDL motif-containing protein 1 n=1 Tax=Megalops atlanticus TaxID=7932 RepID=A0A9D3STZ2_MEGAT|nr:hypothetical protein MATL_G00259290 [Megalops atlanticus]
MRLVRFEKTNEIVLNFDGLSNVWLRQTNKLFVHRMQTLVEMKKDLDCIFRRMRCCPLLGVGGGLSACLRAACSLSSRVRAWDSAVPFCTAQARSSAAALSGYQASVS